MSVPEDARIIQRVFRAFIEGKAITRIAKDLNDEHVPTEVRLKGGWNVSTVSRILKVKDEKYIGGFVWSRTTTVKDPLSGRMKQVDRPNVDSHPTHLLSRALECGACRGAIALVNGRGVATMAA